MRERKISGIKRWKISGFSDMIEGMLYRAEEGAARQSEFGSVRDGRIGNSFE